MHSADWRHLRFVALTAALAVAAPRVMPGVVLLAQGITTASIRGTVRAKDSTGTDATRIRVVNGSTGFGVDADVRHGRFTAPGLETGGPYAVYARRIGFVPQQRDGLILHLGQTLELDFLLEPVVGTLGAVRVVASEQPAFSRRLTGTATTIPDSLLHRLPTLNRDLYDFARLAPQISTKVLLPAGGISGGGAGLRFNSFLIDGASERFVSGNSSLAFGGAKSVSIEAVKEYQVLLAPYDVRYGDFAGALVNSVTRSGTNELRGSAFVYARNDRLSRQDAAASPYDREQYGFMLGGPVVRDRLHFLIAPEFQRLTAPAAGPYLGTPGVPVSAADVARFADILRGYGLVGGSGGAVADHSPLTNLFARLDYALPAWNSRVVLSENYASSAPDGFLRSATGTFPLSSYQSAQSVASSLTSLQIHTSLRRGAYNEMIVSNRIVWSDFTSSVREPIVEVTVPGIGVTTETLRAGTQESAQGVMMRGWNAGLTDNLTVPIGAAHELTIGVQAELFQLQRAGVAGNYGTWTFSSLDSLQNGIPGRFETAKDLGSAGVPMAGGQYGAYAGDVWRASKRLSLTFGLRADVLLMRGHAPYTQEVDSLFRRRTDEMPGPIVQLSPRIGFNWDLFGAGRDQLRGGAGIFTGRFPLSWAHSALYSYGTGSGMLKCGTLPNDLGAPPRFVADYREVPNACAKGLAGAPHGDVDLVDRHLRMAQTARASLAYDRRLPWDVQATVEGLITRSISDFIFVNLNLKGPQGVDAHGRVMYGTVNTAGVATPASVSGFSEVVDLQNIAEGHASQVSTRLEKRFSSGFAGTLSYTYSRVRDVQLPLRAGVPSIQIWAAGRAVSGLHDDLSTGISLYDLPHRVVLAGTYTAPWRRWTTDFSFYYVGESGTPVTYVAWGDGKRGDLNADGAGGSAGNDPVYIPKSSFDNTEIVFSGRVDTTGADNSIAAMALRSSQQQVAFDRLIDGTDCLRRQRGRIMERNSCREPWSNTTIASVRQSVPLAHGHTITAQLDVFNVLNLIRSDWGHYNTANSALLEQVGETPGPLSTAQPIFHFDTARPLWVTSATQSAYQLQLSLRYSF